MSVTPPWLNCEFVRKILRNHENDQSIEIQELSMKPAVAKGENYTGHIIRVGVDYSSIKSGQKSDKKISLIFKIMMEMSGMQKKMIAIEYNTEIRMMSTVLEKMNDILKGKASRLCARILHHDLGNPSFIVMEDLAPLNYRLANRQIGLDLEHSLLTIRRIAEFHASSVALWEKDPSAAVTGCKGIYNDEFTDAWKLFVGNSTKAVAIEVANWSELGSDAKPMSDKLHLFAKDSFKRAAECATPRENDFNVINHGDCWLNNMLFHYNEEGKLTDQIFVDFQMSVWASPAIDIMYLFNSSISEDVELYHRGVLLDKYVDTLTKTMTAIGCKTKPPSITELKKSLQDRIFYEMITSFLVLPATILDSNDAPNLDELLASNNFYECPSLKTPVFRRKVSRRLREWKEQGFLDMS